MTHPHFQPDRRRWLAAGAAWGSLGLAGCATPSTQGPPIGRVVVVGGGFGGATAARYLRLWGGNVQVTLVERQAQFVSCPMSNLVVGGLRQMADISHGFDGLRALGVQVVQGEAAHIDGAARQLRLADGRVLPYDRLIISPGIDFMLDQVPGLAEAFASNQAVHAWKAGPQTATLRQQLQAMPDGGVLAISIPRAPYRCPPAPYERACLAAAYLKRNKPRSKVLVLDANPEIQSKKALFERAFAQHYAGIIEYQPNTELKEVAGGLARFEFDDVKADVLNVVPPQRAADLARHAGLLTVNQRWVGVNWLSFESTAMPGVHVLGDALFPAPQMPKSGHMANQQAKVAAAAVIQLLKGEPINPDPLVMNTCYSFVTPAEAVHVASVHHYDAAQRTFLPVHGAGGLSVAANELEARYALNWATTIWHDMLG
jgi:sulfide dehydrogenase [flavocytochrome c] flavoprotein subunit